MSETEGRYSPLAARLTLFVFSISVPLLLLTTFGGRYWGILDALALTVFLVAALRTGMFFDDERLVVRNLFVTRRYGWPDVERIEPTRAESSELLAVTVGGRKRRVLITIGPGKRGEHLPTALRSVLGSRRADGIIGFRAPVDPRSWSRRRSSWRSK